MIRLFLLLSSVISALSVMGCASLQQIIKPSAGVEPAAGVQALPPYSGPKARIAVVDFEVKAAKATGEIGAGLREMLITALVNSNRFSVVERQSLKAVMKEQQLFASGAADQESKIERGEIKTADLLVAAALTEFEPQASGGRAGVGAAGGVDSGVIGSLLGGALNKAHLALDIRLIDASTSEIIAATRVQGQASDISGAIMTGFLGSWGISSRLSAYANTPMEKAVRICIIEAVKYLAQTAPTSYYKY